MLRRFGQTGLTVPEIGLTTTGRGGDQALVAPAVRLGLRFLCLPTPVRPEVLAEAGGDTLLATADELRRAGRWVPPAPPAERRWDLLIADLTRNSLLDREFLTAARAEMDAGGFGALGARVHDEAGVRRVIDTGAFAAIELAFGLRQQNLLLRCRQLLRDWGGAVIVRLVPAVGGPRVDRWLATEAGERTLSQVAVQAVLLSDVVSVVVQRPHDETELRELAACSRELPALTPAVVGALDRALAADGVRSNLGEFHRRRPAVPLAARRLADSWTLGPLRLRNRIVRSGATERAVDRACLPTDAMRSLYHALAAGGAGMIITGCLAVSRYARANQSNGVLRPGPAVAAWRDILTACRREADVAFCAQLGYRGTLSTGSYDERVIVRAFARAAKAAEAAGFDAVQLHGAHGYLLGQLLAEAPPLRTIGPAAGHHGLDLVRRVIDTVRAEVGDRLAVLMKLNCSDFVSAGYDQRDSLVAVRALADSGLDGVEWSGWVPAAPAARTPSRRGEVEVRSEGFFVPFAARTKAENPNLAVGTCGGFRSTAGATRAVDDYHLDFVSLARPLVAEPDLPRKLLSGLAQARCDGCNECLAKQVSPLHCPRVLVSSGPHSSVPASRNVGGKAVD
ncbi:hypothetical protein GCM10027436_39710 [Actinophytocola sediminis]